MPIVFGIPQAAHEKMDGPIIQEPEPFGLKHNIGRAAVTCITLREDSSIEMGGVVSETRDRAPRPRFSEILSGESR
jgi:hypothetical protein